MIHYASQSGTSHTIHVTPEQKQWVVSQAKQKGLSQSALLQQIIQDSFHQKEPLPEPEDAQYSASVYLPISQYLKTAMLYRSTTVTSYIRQVLQQEMAKEKGESA